MVPSSEACPVRLKHRRFTFTLVLRGVLRLERTDDGRGAVVRGGEGWCRAPGRAWGAGREVLFVVCCCLTPPSRQISLGFSLLNLHISVKQRKQHNLHDYDCSMHDHVFMQKYADPFENQNDISRCLRDQFLWPDKLASCEKTKDTMHGGMSKSRLSLISPTAQHTIRTLRKCMHCRPLPLT